LSSVQNIRDIQDHTGADSRPQLHLQAASLPVRLAGFVSDSVQFGLPTAGMNYVTASRTPIEPEKIWRNFTRVWPAPMQAIIDGYPFPAQRRRIIEEIYRRTSAEGIEYHYDVSNAFYELFLDRRFMFYSCADFLNADDTLEQAQLNKADYILGLLEPKAGEKIMELGSGWGSMMRHVHAHTGDKDHLSGVTLSKDQLGYIRQKFGFNVQLDDFIRMDYGVETYDKFYSIGAMEHVRPDDVLPLYKRLHAALRPGGRVVLHFFSLNGTDRWPPSMVSSQLVFPGSLLSLHSDHLDWARQAGFRLTHDSKHDYRPTLRAWFDRLVENRDKAHALVGIQTTNKYLGFFAASWSFFDCGIATLHRLVLMKD
jgi:cyclopropane-fatty-acyl-phospholipid synthase